MALPYAKQDVVVLDRGNGTSAVVHLYGATIISWKCVGEEMLFLSEKSLFDNKKAIRGGIPIVFPHFGPWKYGPQHGFARISRWKLDLPPTKDKNGNVFAAFCLEENEQSINMLNIMFKLVYTLRLEESSFQINFSIHNTDKITYDFTCLLHTYILTPDVEEVEITDLKTLTYVDKLTNKEVTEENEKVQVHGETDRIYKNAPRKITVKTTPNRIIMIETHNFPDIVVWNPWKEKVKGMADMGNEEYKKFVCVEVGNVTKSVEIKSGQSFECVQTISALAVP